MKPKQIFMDLVQKEIFDKSEVYNKYEGFNDAEKYFNSLKEEKEKIVLTDKGKVILDYMRESLPDYNNVFTSKVIGENINMTSRSVSGSMKKLVTEGFVEKIGQNPATYGVTEKGINFEMGD